MKPQPQLASQFSHTPGPWTIRGAQHASGDDRRDMAIVGAGPDHILAEVFYRTAADTVQPVEANARLIAAAPELLEAARAAFHALKSYECGNRATALASEIAGKLADAICKVDGH